MLQGVEGWRQGQRDPNEERWSLVVFAGFSRGDCRFLGADLLTSCLQVGAFKAFRDKVMTLQRRKHWVGKNRENRDRKRAQQERGQTNRDAEKDRERDRETEEREEKEREGDRGRETERGNEREREREQIVERQRDRQRDCEKREAERDKQERNHQSHQGGGE